MFTWLEGKKTYLVGVLMALLNFAQIMHWLTLTPEQLDGLNAVLAALGLVALRAGVSKAEPVETPIP